MSISRGIGRGIILFVLFSQYLLSSTALATNHIVRLNEIMAGLNGDSSIQFVEVTADGPGQKAWGPQFGETVGRGMLVFFDASGVQIGRFIVPSNPGTASDNVLFATQAFVDATGLTPDFIIPPLVTPNAGKVCFRGNPDNFGSFIVNVCLSYGGAGFSGSTEGAGPTNPAVLSVLGSQSLSRINFDPFGLFGDGAQSNADFVLTDPTPASSQATLTLGTTNINVINNVVAEVTLPQADSLVNQGKILFEKETFSGNGRTCASCHIEVDSFGMTPATVGTLPATDPLFIHEQNISQIIVNSQGSIQPFANTNTTQPSDYFVGSTITGSLGGSATVLAGNGNSYLIIGGSSLNIPGNILSDANGNTGSLVAFITGDLIGPNPVNGSSNGLEISSFLRGPRALVLENINGFDQLEVMRGSPSLLNIKHTAPFGLSGEFATLQDFSAGAVAQHFPRRLQRVAGTDFRNPSVEELDALTAFQESIINIADENFDEANNFSRFATTEAQKRGRDLFFGTAKCSACHNGPVLATSDGTLGTTQGVNEEFNTGVAMQLINITDGLPTEQDVGQPANSRTFSTPTLFGVKHTAPFFHDNSVSSLLEAIQFYDGPEFRNSPAAVQVGTIDDVAVLANAQDIQAFLEALVDRPFDLTRKLNFRNVPLGGTRTMTATLTNSGTANLTVTNVVLNGVNAAEYSETGFAPNSGPILPGETRTIDVTLTPVATGNKLATLEMTVNDGVESFDVGVELVGAEGPVLPEPEVDVTPMSIDFGNQDIGAGPTASQTISVNNIGSATGDLNIVAVNLVGASAADFNISSDSGETTIVPGGSRQIGITFDPTNLATSNAILQIETDDGDESIILIPLAGVGVPPQLASISISPNSVSVPLGASQAFSAIGTFSDGSTQNVTSTVTWSSSNPAVVNINSNGSAATLSQGVATISASSNSIISNNATLTVTAPEVSSLFLTPSSLAFIPLGQSLQFRADAVMTNGSFIDVTNSVAWSSTNTLAATVNGSGLVSTVTQGMSTSIRATATTTSGSVIRSATVVVDPPALVSFTVSPSSASIPLGLTQAFTAQGTFSDGSVQNVTNNVIWQSTNTGTATIGFSSGIAASVNQGSTTIFASSGGITSTNNALLTVTAPNLVSINVLPATINLSAGSTQQFIATGIFSDGSSQIITNTANWNSSNPTVASISAGGLVTANTAGSTSITASQNGITSSGSSVNVAAASLTDILINPNGPQSIEVGETLALTATGVFSNGSNSDITSSVTWSSSNNAVAVVDVNGNLTGLSVGPATITASSGGVSSSNSVSLSVTAPVVIAFSISPAIATVAAGDSIQFTATATLSNGGTSDITNELVWSSTDSAIATFNSTPGLLTGVSNGTVSVGGSHNGIPSDNTTSTEVTTRPLQVRINEVMAGLNGDSNIQFVELVTEDVVDKLWGPQGSETTGRLMLAFFDRNDNQAGRFVVPNDPDSSAGSANTILFATQEFVTLTGITPDFVIPKQLMPISGKLCVKSNPDNSSASPLNLCLSYGGAAFTGNAETPDGVVNANSLPIMDSVSLIRSNFGSSGQFGNGNQFNGDFVAGIPTPASTQAFGSDSALTRNLDQEVTMPAAASLAEQGDVLFSNETFQGNGRTCASCHVPTEAFGMPPSHVATVPNDDPLFVNEFNVNTLIVVGASQPSDYRIGDVVTGSLGGSAKIIAGTNDTYFMYGGLGLNIPGNVITDSLGNSATLLTVVQGDLDTLEDSNVLRGLRALVTENINGFLLPAFLRSSPTLLNIKHTAPFGLSGEFATLQEFTSGAVQQHFPLSLNRVDGADFRIPTTEELDAMTAFQETILTVADENFDEANNFDRFVTTEAQKRGRDLFFGEAKCSVCHSGNVLATSDGTLGTTLGINENFNTGVMLQQINIDDGLPTEQNVGQPDNSREFNTPPLMGIRDTAPFFHESSAATLLEAVLFYDSLAFRNSPAATQVGTIDAVADPQNAADIVAFLEALVDAPADLTRSLDFGQVDIGVPSGLTATITNSSQANITISNAIINGIDASEFALDNAAISGTVITPGNSFAVNVTFSPTLGGTKSATIELVVNQSGKVFTVGTSLSGTSTVQLVSLDILPVSATIELGTTANFTATGLFNDGSQSDVSSSVTWSSSNAAVVSISNSGLATAIAEGTATINAVSGAVNATTQATVTVVNGNIAVSANTIQFPDHDINNPVSPLQTLTITNNGAGVLAISSISVFGTNAAEFAILNDSGETGLAPSASRTFDVEFNPSAAGMRVAGVRIDSDDTDQTPLDISLEGVGLNPQVSVVPITTLNLGTVAVDAGSSSPIAAVITNTGESNLTISSVSITGANSAEFTIVADTAETVLTQNMSRTVNIAFDPEATGQRTANLQIATNDFDNPTVSISLTGEGVANNVVIPNIQVTPNTVDYPDAQDINNKIAILKTVAITNTGNGDLAIANIELTGANPDAFVIVTDSGESVIAPMEARTIVLNFSPNETGDLSATLAITSNDPDSPTIEVPITGEGVANNVVIPNIQVTPNTVEYPDAQDINNKIAILKTVAITNTGNADLEIANIELTGPNRDAFVITTDSGESVIAPMESRTIVLNFSPNDTGNLSAALTITSNDPDSPTIEIPITGEAVQQDGGTGGDDSGGGAMHLELLALLSFLLLSRARIRRRENQL